MSNLRVRADVRGGALFKAAARVDFDTVTRSRYDGMKRRPAIKRQGGLPFTLEQFRVDVLGVLCGRKDGSVECRYCRARFTIAEISPDHFVPLGRGGDAGLNNLDYPCINCNRAKGAMKPDEFLKLIAFLERELPEARTDVLGRLSKAISLSVAARRAHGKARAEADKAARILNGPAAQQLALTPAADGLGDF